MAPSIVAVVTDIASSVGNAIANELIRKKIHVYGIVTPGDVAVLPVTKVDRTENSKTYLHIVYRKTHTEDDIKTMFSDVIDCSYAYLLMLVNYISFETERFSTLTGSDTKDLWQQLIDTKQQRMEIYAREAIKTVKAMNIIGGYILNINSGFGHCNFYEAWKNAVSSLSKTLENELSEAGSKIEVTTITENACAGEIFMQSTVKEFLKHLSMVPSDIAQAVINALMSYDLSYSADIIGREFLP